MGGVFLIVRLLVLFVFSSLNMSLVTKIDLVDVYFCFLTFDLAGSRGLDVCICDITIRVLLCVVLTIIYLKVRYGFRLFLVSTVFFLFSVSCIILEGGGGGRITVLLYYMCTVTLVVLCVLSNFCTPLCGLSSIMVGDVSVTVVSNMIFLVVAYVVYLLRFVSSRRKTVRGRTRFSTLARLPGHFCVVTGLGGLFRTRGRKRCFLTVVSVSSFGGVGSSFKRGMKSSTLGVLTHAVMGGTQNIRLDCYE